MERFFTEETEVLESVVSIDMVEYVSQSAINGIGDRTHILKKPKGRTYFIATQFKNGRFSSLTKIM